MKRSVRYSALSFALILVACATMPKAFNEKLGSGYATVTEVRETTTTLLEADQISVQNAENIQKQADNFRLGLDIAREMHLQAKPGSDSKLDSVISGLTALRAYVRNPK